MTKDVPKNWDEESCAEKWYAFFNGENVDNEGVTTGDLNSGALKYTSKIREHLDIVMTAAPAAETNNAAAAEVNNVEWSSLVAQIPDILLTVKTLNCLISNSYFT